jgi:uncharacterized protein (TIGR02147 family)
MWIPDLYEYSDYRGFLRDLYERNKALDAKFSYRFFAQHLGFASSATLKLVIEGTRNLSKKSLLAVSQGLGFEGRIAEYFENLVFYNQAEKLTEKDHFFAKLNSLQRQGQMVAVERDQFAYFEKWYHTALRELVCMQTNSQPQDLAAQLSPEISPADVQASLELMLRTGFLDQEGSSYFQTEPVIGLHDTRRASVLVGFQKNMLQLAQESFERFPPDARVGSSTTFGISTKTYKDFVKLLREFRTQLTELARRDPEPERVYQLCIHLFPLSKEVSP